MVALAPLYDALSSRRIESLCPALCPSRSQLHLCRFDAALGCKSEQGIDQLKTADLASSLKRGCKQQGRSRVSARQGLKIVPHSTLRIGLLPIAARDQDVAEKLLSVREPQRGSSLQQPESLLEIGDNAFARHMHESKIVDRFRLILGRCPAVPIDRPLEIALHAFA